MVTHDMFVKKLGTIQPNIRVLGTYKKASEKIAVECVVCGKKWSATPNNLTNSHSPKGCPRCRGSERLTHDEFVRKVSLRNPTVEILGRFVGTKKHILTRCKKCNYEWSPVGDTLIAGNACPMCARITQSNKKTLTNDVFLDRLRWINSNITPLTQYIKSNKNILFECNACGNRWSASPHNVLRGTGCPACSLSRGERAIANILKKHNIEFYVEHTFDGCKNKRVLPFDFYVPKYNLCIEYDGIQHFEAVEHFGGKEKYEARCKIDTIKDEYCKSNGINLLRIPYTRYASIDEIVHDYLFDKGVVV